jgi:hypothetical protein
LTVLIIFKIKIIIFENFYQSCQIRRHASKTYDRQVSEITEKIRRDINIFAENKSISDFSSFEHLFRRTSLKDENREKFETSKSPILNITLT